MAGGPDADADGLEVGGGREVHQLVLADLDMVGRLEDIAIHRVITMVLGPYGLLSVGVFGL